MELIGHDVVVKILQKWKTGGCKDPPYYNICGPSGIGKRTIIKHVFNDYEIVSFCSETKKKDILEEIRNKLSVTTFGDFFDDFVKTLILIEDVDKTVGDTKFYKELLKITEKSKYPVLMTCKLKKRTYKNVIDVLPVKDSKIINVLKTKYDISLARLTGIVKDSRGDIRSCINILDLAQKTNTSSGIYNSDSFLISSDAIQSMLTSKYSIVEGIKICENDFQNISEMLFYNIPYTSKSRSKKSNKSAVEDLDTLAKLYDNASFGDTIMKYIHRGHKDSLIGQFVTIACLPVINNINIKKFKQTKLSIPYIECHLPSDIGSYMLAFEYITVPMLFNNNKFIFYENKFPSKELFIKIFRIIFKRAMKKKEKTLLESFYKN